MGSQSGYNCVTQLDRSVVSQDAVPSSAFPVVAFSWREHPLEELVPLILVACGSWHSFIFLNSFIFIIIIFRSILDTLNSFNGKI